MSVGAPIRLTRRLTMDLAAPETPPAAPRASAFLLGAAKEATRGWAS
jgi:hypothetical protein